MGVGLTLGDLDPLYGILFAISPTAANSGWLKLVRIPVNVYGFLYMHLTGQALFWIPFLENVLRCQLLCYLVQQSLRWSHIMDYKRLQITYVCNN